MGLFARGCVSPVLISGDSNQASAYPRLSGGQPSLETVPNTVGLSPSGALPSGHSRGVLVRCRGKGGRPAMAVTTGFSEYSTCREPASLDLRAQRPMRSRMRERSPAVLERETAPAGPRIFKLLARTSRPTQPRKRLLVRPNTSGVECSEPREHESHAETASGTIRCARRGHDGLHGCRARIWPERYLVEMRRRVTIATASRAPPRTPWKPPWYSTSSTWQRRFRRRLIEGPSARRWESTGAR